MSGDCVFLLQVVIEEARQVGLKVANYMNIFPTHTQSKDHHLKYALRIPQPSLVATLKLK